MLYKEGFATAIKSA